MWYDLFRDKAFVNTDGQSINVTFTHWIQRRHNFSVRVDDIVTIEAVQIEPFTMELILVTKDNSRWAITDEMTGWDKVLEFVRKTFAGFDPDAYEKAKGDINQTRLCWSHS